MTVCIGTVNTVAAVQC